MTDRTLAFDVEQAGCESCAQRVRAALAPLGTVAEVAIDADADTASVRLQPAAEVGEDEVAAALEHASHGSGHRPREARLVAQRARLSLSAGTPPSSALRFPPPALGHRPSHRRREETAWPS